MSPTGLKGGHLEAIACAKVLEWAEQNSGVAFGPSAGFMLPDGSVRSPDSSWLSQAAWDSLSEAERDRFAPRCPEFLIEILSPSDPRERLEAKMEMWIANGAQLAWLINPYARTVSIYRPGAATETLEAPESVTAETVVPGFTLPMAKFWAS